MNEVDDGAEAIAGGVVSRDEESPHQSTSRDLDESQGERKPLPAFGQRQFSENNSTSAILPFSSLQILRTLNDDDGGKNDDRTVMRSLPSRSSYTSLQKLTKIAFSEETTTRISSSTKSERTLKRDASDSALQKRVERMPQESSAIFHSQTATLGEESGDKRRNEETDVVEPIIATTLSKVTTAKTSSRSESDDSMNVPRLPQNPSSTPPSSSKSKHFTCVPSDRTTRSTARQINKMMATDRPHTTISTELIAATTVDDGVSMSIRRDDALITQRPFKDGNYHDNDDIPPLPLFRCGDVLLTPEDAFMRPGALAIRGSWGRDDSMSNDIQSSFDSSDLSLVESPQELSSATTSVILMAQRVAEDEERRLRDAEEFGRQQILKDVVQATVIEDTENTKSAPDRNRHLDRKLVWLIVISILMVIIAVVTISVVVAAVTRSKLFEKADDQDHIIPTTNIIISSHDPTNTLVPTTTNNISTAPNPDPPVVVNDLCEHAYPITMDGSITNDTLLRHLDATSTAVGQLFQSCFQQQYYYVGQGPTAWYTVEGNGRMATVTLCGDPRHVLFVYKGACPVPTCVGEEGQWFSYECNTHTWKAELDNVYYLLVAAFDIPPDGDDSMGYYQFRVNSNDHCDYAPFILPNSSQSGSTKKATVDPANACNNYGFKSALSTGSVWYRVFGTGQTLTFHTCHNTEIDTQLYVYTGSCQDLTCVGGSNDALDCRKQSSVSWLSELNTIYHIRIIGVIGSFTLTGFESPPYDVCQGAEVMNDSISAVYAGSTVNATATWDAEYLSLTIYQDQRSFENYFKEEEKLRFQCHERDGSFGYSYSPGVWYQLDAKAHAVISVDTCNNSTSFKPNIKVMQGTCEQLQCIQREPTECIGLDDDCFLISYRSCNNDPYEPFRDHGVIATWSLEQDATIYIFVFGDTPEEVGDFILNVTINSN